MKKLIVFAVIMLLSSSAGATVYKWTDDAGVVNFADEMNKVPAAYRDSVQEVKTPKLISQNAQTGKTPTKAPPISQPLVREGDFATQLAEALKVGRTQNEAEAESLLASANIAPRNGWIADYPVTPDIIGELQNAISEAADSGKLGVSKEEAMSAFQDLIAQQGLPLRAEKQNQYAAAEQPYSDEEPPQDYPQYYEPSVVNNYYSEEGPPVVTYYPPPPDYYYLYSWVPISILVWWILVSGVLLPPRFSSRDLCPWSSEILLQPFLGWREQTLRQD